MVPFPSTLSMLEYYAESIVRLCESGTAAHYRSGRPSRVAGRLRPRRCGQISSTPRLAKRSRSGLLSGARS